MECKYCKNEMNYFKINNIGGFFYCKYFCDSYIHSDRKTCEHKTIIVNHFISNGNIQFRNQCIICGDLIGKALRKNENTAIRNSQPFYDNFEKNSKYYYDILTEQGKKYELKRKEYFDNLKNEESEKYNKYLNSDKWQTIRAKVLTRDKFICQGCGEKANTVHHLSYENKYNELLFQLISLCNKCHEKIHKIE